MQAWLAQLFMEDKTAIKMCKPGPPLKLSRNKSESEQKIKKKRIAKKSKHKWKKNSHKNVQARSPTQAVKK